MKPLLKIEFERAIKNQYMLMAMIIGMVISVSHVFTSVLPLADKVWTSGYPLTVFGKWMGGENSSIQPILYFLLVPILMSMPYLATIHQDRRSGYVKNVFTRTNKMKYYISKYIVTLITAGFVAILPLVFNFILCAMILPATVPQASTGMFPIFNISLMGELFYTHPFAYLLAYFALDFVFFGLLATIGLTIAFVADNVFVVMLSPFMLYLITYAVTQLTNTHSFCP